MSSFQMVFKRYEVKYMMDSQQYKELMKMLEGKMEIDQYGKTTICNIYFDTPDSLLIRTSMEKPVYKEKLRLRSYGTPHRDSKVFIELKKKYEGVVYKRREVMSLADSENYLYRNQKPAEKSQVLHEIDWFLSYYENVIPAMYISYDRIALYGREDPDLRVTIDDHLLWREKELNLEQGVWGQTILEPGQHLMEIKTPGSMPLWLSTALNQLSIYPVSFSKYGKAYGMMKQEKLYSEGGRYIA